MPTTIPFANATMSDSLWHGLQHFKRSEAWGDPNRMKYDLLTALERLREYVGKPVTIHCGTQGTHTKDSQHYLGNAVDLHIEGLHVFDQFVAASRFAIFRGIGVYPHWHNPGLHLDIRPLPADSPRAIWMQDLGGKYIDLTAVNVASIFGR